MLATPDRPLRREPFLLVTAARTVWTLVVRTVFYVALFLTVVALHVSLTTGLRASGMSAGGALFFSGTAVLGAVVGLLWLFNAAREIRRARLSEQAQRLGLPVGPCCVIWRGDRALDLPWDFAEPPRADYPPIARKLGVEGYALVEFEVGADGRARSVHCLDAWPSPMFYEAARAGLGEATFRPVEGITPRFGASYRLPFVFRMRGAAQVADPAFAARPPRPAVERALRAFTKS